MMKKITCLGILALVFSLNPLVPQQAWAQTAAAPLQKQKPQPTRPDYIAMLFYKLSRTSPDFKIWARMTPEYQAASSFDKITVQDQQIQLLKNVYSLLTLQEPIIVETPVKLSDYSAANNGFVIENFRVDTFFPFRYNNQIYAIIPIGIMDQQWLKIPDPVVAEKIRTAAKKGPLTMSLVLAPKYADASEPAVIDKENYWLMSAEIKSMTLYSATSNTPLWQPRNNTPDDAKRQELLKLRQ